jgi:hypothetical protein
MFNKLWRCWVKRSAVVLCGSVIFLLLSCFAGYGEEKQDGQQAVQGQAGSQQGQAPAAQNTPAKVEEAPPAVTGTGSLGAYNKYIFRGYELSRKSVVIEPSLSATYQGFSVTFWGNIDSREHGTQNLVPDRPDQRSFNETDLTLSYTRSIGKWSLTGGWIYYGLKYANETQELFGSVTYDMIGKPTLAVYRDIDQYPGTYFNFSLSHSIKVYKEATFDMGASAGYMWGDGNFWKTYQPSTGGLTGSNYNAFHDGKVQIGFTIPVGKKVTIVPIVQYWFPLSDKASRHYGPNSYNPNGYLGTNFVGGASVNYNF